MEKRKYLTVFWDDKNGYRLHHAGLTNDAIFGVVVRLAYEVWMRVVKKPKAVEGGEAAIALLEKYGKILEKVDESGDTFQYTNRLSCWLDEVRDFVNRKG